MKDISPQEYGIGYLRLRKSCRDTPITLTSNCRMCSEYRGCKHAWRVSEQLEDF